jgi:molybdopterin-dependent oxidoreductase alpha subunit
MGIGKHVNPHLWASLKPLGLGQQRPNNYMEIVRAGWENRDRAGYAWRILNEACCDGCALGTKGLHDWTIEGTHLCNVRLRLLRLNTAPPFDASELDDVSELSERSTTELREMGRIPHPFVRRKGDRGFKRASWDEALDLIGERVKQAGPDRTAGFLTSRGMTNESYYAAQKSFRALGTNNIDNAARVCHSPSTFGLKEAVGVGATTCSYTDWFGSDLIIFIGSNIANNQPVAMKYLHEAKVQGTKVALVGPYQEPGMKRYWVPSNPESALFGTKITDRFFDVDTGGDLSFFTGTLKHMIERGWTDDEFIERHTSSWDELRPQVLDADWGTLEKGSGASRAEMLAFAEMLRDARTAVFVWSMGVTQHINGEDHVRSIINLALSKGFVGREKCGLMPIRGHSGVQGGAEMGAYCDQFPGPVPVAEDAARELAEDWGFDVPAEPGLSAAEMVEAGERGELDVLIASGGNFLEVLPDPDRSLAGLKPIPLRVHMDLVLTPQMLVEPEDTVVVLPAATRYEVEGGVTETSTERRIIYSPEVEGPRIDDARPEFWVFAEIAARVRPERAEHVRFESTAAIRSEIARVVPAYDGIQHLREAGDSFQYGGPMIGAGWKFDTDDGRAHFTIPELPPVPEDDDRLRLSTRRGKQFNSMVQEHRDALTGAARESVLLSEADAVRLGLSNNERVLVRSDTGELEGNVLIAPVKPGNVQVHWPEGNVLIEAGRRSPEAQIPDYNAWVTIESVRKPAERGLGADRVSV